MSVPRGTSARTRPGDGLAAAGTTAFSQGFAIADHLLLARFCGGDLAPEGVRFRLEFAAQRRDLGLESGALTFQGTLLALNLLPPRRGRRALPRFLRHARRSRQQ